MQQYIKGVTGTLESWRKSVRVTPVSHILFPAGHECMAAWENINIARLHIQMHVYSHAHTHTQASMYICAHIDLKYFLSRTQTPSQLHTEKHKQPALLPLMLEDQVRLTS